MKIQELVGLLRSLAPEEFVPNALTARLADVSVDDASLRRYLCWEAGRYTRNSIYRDDVFELLAVCWEKGSASPIHNHAGQDCWLYIHTGQLCIDSFDLVDPEHCGREGSEICVRKRERIHTVEAGTVDHRGPDNDLHRVMNRRAFDARAVSLHIYSRPFDSCITYDAARGVARRVSMRYDSVNGERCTEASTPLKPLAQPV